MGSFTLPIGEGNRYNRLSTGFDSHNLTLSSTAQASNSKSSGLAGSLLWGLIWILGTAAICWFTANRSAPRVENQILSGIQSVLKPLTAEAPVLASVHGRDATLNGRVLNEQHRATVLSAVEGVAGVRSVTDEMTLIKSTSIEAPIDKDLDTVGTLPEVDSPEPSADPMTLTVIDSSSSESSAESTTLPASEPTTKPGSQSNAESTASQSDTSTEEPSSAAPDETIAEKSSEDNSTTISEPDDNSSLVVAELAINEPEPNVLKTPSLDFNIDGKTLAVSGNLSDKDDVAPLIRTAMVSFDLDYISNTIKVSDDTEIASWLEPLSEFLPAMAALENPSIEVNNDGILLGGDAPNTSAKEAALDAATSSLGAYSMAEVITLKDSASTPSIESLTIESPENTVTPIVADSGNTPTEIAAVETTPTETPSVESSSAETPPAESSSAEATAPEPAEPLDEDSDATNEATDQTEQATAALTSTATVESLQNAINDLPTLNILFKSSSDELTIESLDVLDSIASVFVAHPDIPIRIEGHTDASGSKNENLALSQLRANSVRDYLVDRGVSIYRLKSYGFGDGVPVSDNSTPEGRATNRRIEFNFQR